MKEYKFSHGAEPYSWIFLVVITNVGGVMVGLPFEVKWVSIITFSCVVTILPAAYLHCIYTKWNKNLSIQCSGLGNSLLLWNSKGMLQLISGDNIDKIYRVISHSKLNNTYSIFPWTTYSYYKLIMKTGDEVKITSLLLDDLSCCINSKEVFIVKKFFPL